MVRCLAVVAAIIFFSTVALAQLPGRVKYAAERVSVSPVSAKPGAHANFVISIVVSPGYHINAASTANPSLIATRFTPTASPGFTWGVPHYPASQQVVMFGQRLPVYMGTVSIATPVTVGSKVKPGAYPLQGVITFQGCTNRACYPPKTDHVSAVLTVK